MRVLAIDTALEACQAAVADGEVILAVRSEPMQRGHQERLGAVVQQVMTDAGLAFEQLDRIGVTLGPGSFTGVRVGLAFAKGLALALGVPLIGVGTLEALGASVGEGSPVMAAVDGKRGQIYLQSFGDGQALGPPQSIAIDEALSKLAGRRQRVVGPGAPLLQGLDGAEIVPLPTPELAALARLVAAAPAPSAPPRPIYLRAPDARLPG